MTLTDSVTVNGNQPPTCHWLSTHEALGQLGIRANAPCSVAWLPAKLRRRTLEDGRVQVWLPLPADRQTDCQTLQNAVSR